MKFKAKLSASEKEKLTKEFADYSASHKMTAEERSALTEWVSEGNSVYTNPAGMWLDGLTPMPFLNAYREEESLAEQA